MVTVASSVGGDATQWSGTGKVHIAPDGTAICFYWNGSNWLYRTSSAPYSSWSSSSTVTNAILPGGLSASIDGSGNLQVYVKQTGGPLPYTRPFTYSSGWTMGSATNIDGSGDFANDAAPVASACQDRSGRYWIKYAEWVGGYQNHLYYSSNGTSWTSYYEGDEAANNGQACYIAPCYNGATDYMLYVYQAGGDIRWRRAQTSGGSVGTISSQQAATGRGTHSDHSGDMIALADGRVMLAACPAFGNDYTAPIVAIYSPSSDTWGSNTTVGTNNTDKYPSLALNPVTNNVYLVWSEGSGTSFAIVYREWDSSAGTWGTKQTVQASGSERIYTDCACDGDTLLIICTNNSAGTVESFAVSVGSGGTTLTVNLGGTLTTAGTLRKQINKRPAGTLTMAGALAKRINKVLAGTLTSSGVLRKIVQKLPTGTLSAAGALTTTKVKIVALAGTLSAAGAVAKRINKSLSGTLTTSATLLKRVARAVSGALSLAGGLNVSIPGSLPFRDDFTSGFDPAWDQNDSGGNLSVVDGRAYFEYDNGLNVWNDPSLVSASVTRTELGALASGVRLTNLNDGGLGFKVALAPSATNPEAAGNGAVTLGYPDLFVSGLDEPVNLNRMRGHDYLFATAKRQGGGWFQLVSSPAGAGGEWPEWPDAAIIGVTHVETDATLYAHLAANRGREHVDYATVIPEASLPSGFSTRLGAAAASESSGTRTAGTSSITNTGVSPRIIEARLSRGANNDTRAVICFRGSSSSYANCWKFKGEFDRVSLHDTSGLVTQTGAKSMPASTVMHLMVVDTGDRIDCYVDGERWLTTSSTTGAGNTWAGTACDTGASLSVAVTDFGAWQNITLGNDFGPLPAAPKGKGTAYFTDGFTLANATALAGQNGWLSAGSGTWQANSNQGRMTASGVNGILYRLAGPPGNDVQMEADITLPGSTSTYPTDWFCGVVVRFTDISNYITARFLNQDTGGGPSPEVEVWEYVAGVGNLIGSINLGAGALATGSTHNLRLAALADEVAAYLDGELVVQATTAVLTGAYVGIGVNDNLPFGQPSWDNIRVEATGAVTLTLSLSGTLTTAGVLVKQVRRNLAGTLPTIGALAKQIRKPSGGTLTTSGALGTNIQPGGGNTLPVSVGGTLTTAGTLRKTTAKALLATLAATGAISRRVAKALTATVAPTGTLIKEDRRRLTATASFSGTVTTGKFKLIPLGGTLGSSGGLIVVPLRNVPLGGTLGFSGDVDTTVLLVPPPEAPEVVPVVETSIPEFGVVSESAPSGGVVSKVKPPEFGLRG